jgi:hypothetical protein
MPVNYDKKRVIRPKSQHNWTDEMVLEYAKCAKSVKYFALNHCKVVTLNEGITTLSLRDYQMDLLNIIDNNQKSIFNIPRQSGKCLIFDTKIKIRNKKTGEIQEISIGEFYEKMKKTQ